MKPLTQRQTQALRFIAEFINKHSFPPSRTDLAIELDITRKAAHVLIHALAKKGHVEIIAGSSRGLRLVSDDTHTAPPANSLPLIGRVSAGPPLLATDEVDDWIRVDPGLFHPTPNYLRKVSGTSMIDMGIQDGDLIAIRSQPTADNGQVVVAKLFLGAEPEITVKKYRQRGNKVELIPRNSAMETVVIDLREQSFEIEGLYCGHIHLNKSRR